MPAYLGTYLVRVQAGDPAMADRNGKEGVVCPPLGCWVEEGTCCCPGCSDTLHGKRFSDSDRLTPLEPKDHFHCSQRASGYLLK